MPRRTWTLGWCGLLLGWPLAVDRSHADDPAWLAEVTTPPAEIRPERVGRIEPLLVTAEGKRIETIADWEARRKEIRAAWMKFFGPMTEKRPEVKLEEVRAVDGDDFTRRLMRYETEPGVTVEGWLLRPKRSSLAKNGKLPALVALHQTARTSIDEVAGLSGSREQQIAPALARRGFIVFCPRNYLWKSTAGFDVGTTVREHRERHPPGAIDMHKMLYDALVAVNVLVSLDDVDPNRIGTVGHSLGGKDALYHLAFDERVKAGVASEGGVLFRSTNWHDRWYLGSAIDDGNFPLNHHQLLALCAPRLLLILGGESGSGAVDGNRSWALIKLAQEVYALFGQPVRLGLYNHGQGHSIPSEAYSRMEEWLVKYVAE